MKFVLKLLLGVLVVSLGKVLLSWAANAGGWVIEPDVEYGIWHGVVDGLLFVGNYIRSWFVDVPYKAEIYTTGYNIAYWFIAISEVMQSLRFVFRFTRH